VKAGGKDVAVHGDVSRRQMWGGFSPKPKKAFGRLDVLVNNAAIYKFPWNRSLKSTMTAI
jgi:NAD(P)-dependent dehydrogenase (short-subunit alcohol dehydrogenase family)